MKRKRDIFHNADGTYHFKDGSRMLKKRGYSQTPLCLYHDYTRRRSEVNRVLEYMRGWPSFSVYFLSHIHSYYRKMDALVGLYEGLHELRFHQKETEFPRW